MNPPLDFLAVAGEVVRRAPGLQACTPVVQKELLHVEMLGGLHDAGLLRHLVFKGGTCLRHRAHIVDTVRDLLEHRVVDLGHRAMDSVAP
ncbi:MAG: hypothetical protein OXH09_05840 [Gammaproteobacteria bacterium]|nr:hypothetical protein [Gammaproteobacteria bacterium]